MDFIRFQDSDTLSRSGLILEPDTSTLEHKTTILQSTQTIGFKYSNSRYLIRGSFDANQKSGNIETIDYHRFFMD